MQLLINSSGVSLSMDLKQASQTPVSHMQMVPSSDPEMMCLLSCENTTELTPLVCPINGPDMSFPVFVSQTQIVLSDDPDTIYLLSCEKATEQTGPVCPIIGPEIISPVFASQM